MAFNIYECESRVFYGTEPAAYYGYYYSDSGCSMELTYFASAMGRTVYEDHIKDIMFKDTDVDLEPKDYWLAGDIAAVLLLSYRGEDDQQDYNRPA